MHLHVEDFTRNKFASKHGGALARQRTVYLWTRKYENDRSSRIHSRYEMQASQSLTCVDTYQSSTLDVNA